MPSELVMFVGLPGAGKSYHIDRMYKGCGHSIVDQDEIQSLVPELDYLGAKKVATLLAEKLYQSRNDLVLAATGSDLRVCADWLTRARQSCRRTVLVIVRCSREKAVERMTRRNRVLDPVDFQVKADRIEENIPRLAALVDEVIEIDNELDTSGNPEATGEPASDTESLSPIYDGRPQAHNTGSASEMGVDETGDNASVLGGVQ